MVKMVKESRLKDIIGEAMYEGKEYGIPANIRVLFHSLKNKLLQMNMIHADIIDIIIVKKK